VLGIVLFRLQSKEVGKEIPDEKSIGPGLPTIFSVDTTNTKLYREGSGEQKTESFVPGGIHSKESIQFWRNTL
jgi:hypothetical protein